MPDVKPSDFSRCWKTSNRTAKDHVCTACEEVIQQGSQMERFDKSAFSRGGAGPAFISGKFHVNGECNARAEDGWPKNLARTG